MFLPALLLSLNPSVARAQPAPAPAPHPAEAVGDEALADLAAGRPGAAVRRIRARLAQAPDEATQTAIRCLLGRAERTAGDEAAAITTLAQVPLDAPCGRRAAFDRADALQALGRVEEAAALYAEAGAGSLGEGRDLAVAQRLSGLADRLLADPDADPGQALTLLAMALELELPVEKRVRRAIDLGQRLLEEEAWEHREEVAQVLIARLRSPEPLAPEAQTELRLLAARLSWGPEGEALLDPLPETEQSLLARADVVLSWDPERGLDLLARAVQTSSDPKVRARLARTLQEWRRHAEARPHWTALVAAEGINEGIDEELAAEALFALAQLELDVEPGSPAAIAHLTTWLDRFPSGKQRLAVEAHLADARLDRARTTRRAEDYDAFVRGHPTDERLAEAAYEAGLVALEAGQGEDARSRWLALLASRPDTDSAQRAVGALARQQAFDLDQATAAMSWLRQLRDEGGPLSWAATAELSRFTEPELAALVDGIQDPRRPVVTVRARNLAQVQIRLHRIDPEAFLRAGGRPEGLPDLDVAVIAPDKEWTATLPEVPSGRSQLVEVPLKVPGPGIYAVTVASPGLEARTIALVSEARLITRARGEDLVVGVLRGDRPAGGQRVLVSHAGAVTEARTAADGLARLRVTEGSAVVLSDGPAGPALLALDWAGHERKTDTLRVSVDLDRTALAPGDRLGFRLVGRQAEAPLTGEWRLWIDLDGVKMPEQRLRADRRGLVASELDLPMATGQARLVGVAPGEQAPRVLGTVTLLAPPSASREVEIEREGRSATITVREADGRPVVDAPVVVSHGPGRPDEVVRTDSTGRVQVEGPRQGVVWPLQAQLAGVATPGRLSSTDPVHGPLILHLDQDRPTPQTAASLRIAGGHGPLRVGLFPRIEAPNAPEAPTDPWDPALWTGLEGHQSWMGEAPSPVGTVILGEPTWLEVSREGSEGVDLRLPVLPSGSYDLVALPLGSGEAGARTALTVAEDGPRLGALPIALAAGTRLELPVAGPALVTAESEGIDAAILVRGEARLGLDLPVQQIPMGFVATDSAGRVHTRTLPIEAELRVDLRVEESDGRWRLVTTVTDPAGRPTVAQVALSAVDRRALGDHAPVWSRLGELATRQSTQGGGASLSTLRHGSLAEAIAAALLEETAREEEDRRARSAEAGLLGSNRMAQVMDEETILLGGIGTRGGGSGGGGASGYGQGGGSFGRGEVGSMRSKPGFALRQRQLWTVAETDRDGTLVVELAEPPPATWLVRASAATASSVGSATVEHDAHARAFLVLPELAPGGAGDVARPQAVVVNGSDRPLAAILHQGERNEPIELAPGEQRAVTLGELRPGEALDLRLESAGTVLEQHALTFPVATGEADPTGTLVRVAVAAGGGFPLLAMALEEAPTQELEVGAAARAARSALFAAGALTGAPRAEALARAHQHLALVRARPGQASSVVDRAEVLALLVQASRQLPELAIPRGEIDQAAALLEGGSPESGERVAQLWALALAGRPVDEARVARLVRDAASLDDEGRSWLARTLILLGRSEEATPLIAGAGPHAGLARTALGIEPGPLPAPPAVTGQDRPHWVELAAAQPRTGKGTPVLTVDGVEVGRLDPTTGGELRVVVSPQARVELNSAPAALLLRSALPEGTQVVATARAPRGADGQAVPTDVPARGCGDATNPCRIAVGESLRLAAQVQGDTQASGGLRLQPGAVQAWQPGRYRVTGLKVWTEGRLERAAPLHVEVLATLDEAPPQRAALELAEQALSAEQDPLPLLTPWPGFDDWSTELKPRAMDLRFRAALRGQDAAALIAAFEGLRDGAPDADLALSEVARVARAYAEVGQPARALTAWRAGLGAAFLAETAPIRRVEDQVGRVIGLKAMRELALRYPSIPVVDEAEFHLPERLASMIDEGIPHALQSEGITPTDVRLLAAAWDREFLALHPDSPHAPEAGLHLAQGLLRLRAWASAAQWSDQVARASPDAPVLDALRYVEALARAELGQQAQARTALKGLATGQWPQADGSLGPAALAPDATYALARIAEAQGDRKAAIELYQEVGGAFPEASAALQALTRVALSAEPLVVLESDEDLALPVRLANVETVYLRAYRLDLRTIFLRDGGLDGARSIEVSGVSPVWSGSQKLRADPFPRTVDLDLPLSGDGAWLVQVDAGAEQSSALLVRSQLQIDAQDGPAGRRLVVRKEGQPAAGAEVRALNGSDGVVALRTDLRGVALVPTGAAALVFDGAQLAFTPSSGSSQGRPTYPSPAAPATEGDLLRNLDRRLLEQRQRNEVDFEEQYAPAQGASLKANTL